MARIDDSERTIHFKAAYAGAEAAGKRANLSSLQRMLLRTIPEPHRGLGGDLIADDSPARPMIDLVTEDRRDVFFSFLLVRAGEIRGFQTRVHAYTVPPPSCPLTRASVLLDADVLVLVADSRLDRLEDGVRELEVLERELEGMGRRRDLPRVVQYNKRDLPGIASVQQLRAKLNPAGEPDFEAVATTNLGVLETFRSASKAALLALRQQR